jgi:hypothetical protein
MPASAIETRGNSRQPYDSAAEVASAASSLNSKSSV